jgi:hypothetical protein
MSNWKQGYWKRRKLVKNLLPEGFQRDFSWDAFVKDDGEKDRKIDGHLGPIPRETMITELVEMYVENVTLTETRRIVEKYYQDSCDDLRDDWLYKEYAACIGGHIK